MSAKALAKYYASLTAEERFRLTLAAGIRGDETEQDRLVRAGGRITLSVSDHTPFAHAFNELALQVFVELLEMAGDYIDAFRSADGPETLGESEPAPESEDGDAGEVEAESDAHQKPTWQRYLDVALAHGYMLKTKGDAWKLFCERMSVPAFAVWEFLPGFPRLEHALKLVEQAAFEPEGMVRWLNGVRPEGEPEVTTVPFTTEEVATGLERIFRERAAWWGGPVADKTGESRS